MFTFRFDSCSVRLHFYRMNRTTRVKPIGTPHRFQYSGKMRVIHSHATWQKGCYRVCLKATSEPFPESIAALHRAS